jgi:dienelactone hydrolase
MKNNRRNFLKLTGAASLGFAGNSFLKNLPSVNGNNLLSLDDQAYSDLTGNMFQAGTADETTSIIGAYGQWAAGLSSKELPLFSFRRDTWKNPDKWRKAARKRFTERLSMPQIKGLPEVRLIKSYKYDGLLIEELQWKLPYGNPAEGIMLKPADATGKLPGILAFHDHAGNKYFGTQKITKTSDNQHSMMVEHQNNLYGGYAWANEIARRGFVVLAPDAFPFASRRVMLKDVPQGQRQGLSDPDINDIEGIKAYNNWTGQHENIMAKSLFSAGTTWPGVFLAEDIKALDILCSRSDVDTEHIGCCGLSGGGMRSVFLGGLDDRIKCAIPVGFMTTWKDLVLNKATSHTWMVYVPLLPKELDFPEILGLRAPLPSLVLNDSEDPLFSPSEMKNSEEILKSIYSKAGAGGNFKCSFHPGPHKFDRPMQIEAFDWFEKCLK